MNIQKECKEHGLTVWSFMISEKLYRECLEAALAESAERMKKNPGITTESLGPGWLRRQLKLREIRKLKVGNCIQWECNGTLMFPEPLPITDFSPCGNFCFVEGSRTGIPIMEVIHERKSTENKG